MKVFSSTIEKEDYLMSELQGLLVSHAGRR